MSPKSFSFNPVLERDLVTQQGEPNFLPIRATIGRKLASQISSHSNEGQLHDSRMLWRILGLWLSVSDGKPGTICSWQPVDRVTHPVRYQTIIGVWVRHLSCQPSSGLTRLYIFDSISDIFSHPFSQRVLNEPCVLSWEKGIMEGKWRGTTQAALLPWL